jgi:transcriptional regulator of arginine metabolism
VTTTTAGRRRLIRKLLAETKIASQRQLVGMLAAQGHRVTQATVSRDLDALGAVKAPDGGGTTAYTITTAGPERSDADDRLRRAVNDFVVAIAVSGNIIVLHTPPGGAHLVAGAIDASGLGGVLGTVAGDDTLLVVTAPEVSGDEVADRIERIGAGR